MRFYNRKTAFLSDFLESMRRIHTLSDVSFSGKEEFFYTLSFVPYGSAHPFLSALRRCAGRREQMSAHRTRVCRRYRRDPPGQTETVRSVFGQCPAFHRNKTASALRHIEIHCKYPAGHSSQHPFIPLSAFLRKIDPKSREHTAAPRENSKTYNRWGIRPRPPS